MLSGYQISNLFIFAREVVSFIKHRREGLTVIHKPLGERPHFVSLDIPFLVTGTNKVSFISDCSERAIH